MSTASDLTARRRWLIVERQNPVPCCSGPAIYDVEYTNDFVDVSDISATSILSASVTPSVNGFIVATGTVVITGGNGDSITLTLRYYGTDGESTFATVTPILASDPQVVTISGLTPALTAGILYTVELYILSNTPGAQVAGSLSILGNITETS